MKPFLLHSIAPLLVLAIAPVPAVALQSEEPVEETTYEFGAPETNLLAYGVVFVSLNWKYRWVAWETTLSGTCTTETTQRVCLPIYIAVWVYSFPPFVAPVPAIGHSYEYKRVSLGSTTVALSGSLQWVQKHRWYCPPPITPDGHTEEQVIINEDDVLVHDIVDSGYATFEGEELVYGQEIPMRIFGPGAYTYFIERSDGTNTATYDVSVIVEPAQSMSQIDYPPSPEVLPTSAFEFTNDTEAEMHLFLEATSLNAALEVHLLDNIVSVQPGETVQGEVSFTTLPGYAIPEGATFSARVDAHRFSASGPLLASVEVSAASRAATIGSGEDLRIRTEVNGAGLPSLSTKTANIGDTYSVTIDSPGGTFQNELVVGYYDTFTLLSPIQRMYPELPEFHLSADHLILTTSNLGAAGITSTGTLSSDLSGLILRSQAAVLSPLAANGSFAMSDAHDLVVQ